jgi:lipoate-protein ligase A
MNDIRLLPLSAADGPTNMATDETLLESAADRGVATLRFYTWSTPTLSLGYFQPAAVRDEIPTIGPLPWVRRATGGAAIVHHHELTYALALPQSKEWQPRGESWICRLHHMVQAVLFDFGVKARGVVCGEELKLGAGLCFLHQTPADLTIDGSKVAGSAQRKLRGALLQHGSLLLRRSEFAPSLPGIFDKAGRDLFTVDEFAQRIVQAFTIDTPCAVVPGEWRPEEEQRIPQLRDEKYAAADWNAKR